MSAPPARTRNTLQTELHAIATRLKEVKEKYFPLPPYGLPRVVPMILWHDLSLRQSIMIASLFFIMVWEIFFGVPVISYLNG